MVKASSGKVFTSTPTPAATSPNQGGGGGSFYASASYPRTLMATANHATPTIYAQQTTVTLIKSDPFTIGIHDGEHQYEIVLYPEGDIDVTIDGQPATTRSAAVSNIYDNIKQHIKETGGLF